jgi:hypothetical protein
MAEDLEMLDLRFRIENSSSVRVGILGTVLASAIHSGSLAEPRDDAKLPAFANGSVHGFRRTQRLR